MNTTIEHTHAHVQLKQSMQIVTQKQAEFREGRPKIKQSDCVLCTDSIHHNQECFYKVSSGLKSNLLNGFHPAGGHYF